MKTLSKKSHVHRQNVQLGKGIHDYTIRALRVELLSDGKSRKNKQLEICTFK